MSLFSVPWLWLVAAVGPPSQVRQWDGNPHTYASYAEYKQTHDRLVQTHKRLIQAWAHLGFNLELWQARIFFPSFVITIGLISASFATLNKQTPPGKVCTVAATVTFLPIALCGLGF